MAGYVERARRWADGAGLPVGVVNAGGGIGVDYAALDRPYGVLKRGSNFSRRVIYECSSRIRSARGM